MIRELNLQITLDRQGDIKEKDIKVLIDDINNFAEKQGLKKSISGMSGQGLLSMTFLSKEKKKKNNSK